MTDQNAGNDDKPLSGLVLLPLPGGVCLQMFAHKGEPERGAVSKCRLDRADARPLEAAMAQGARMARLVEPHRPGALQIIRLALEAKGALAAAPVEAVADLSAWAAAAAAWADRIARRQALDWARCTVLLGGMEIEEDDPQRWGLIQPLPAPLEQAALQALQLAPADAPWADALIVLPGDESRYGPLRQELHLRWPRAKVCTADSLAALTSPGGHVRQRRVGQVWFPLVSAQGATLHPLRVVVAPWRPTASERPPVEVVYRPAPARDLSGDALTKNADALLTTWRRQEQPASAQQWKTLVQLPGVAVGNSYQLALAVADRIARGREWQGPGRVFATGGVSDLQGDSLRVTNVSGTLDFSADPVLEAANPKLDAFFAEAQEGDTVLLPDHASWRSQVSARLGPPRADGTCTSPQGARVVFVRRVLP